MGGNPGSSARCLQCSQRKKKCGLERPSCLRCMKSGIQCSGPREDSIPVFIHRDANNLLEPGKAALTAAFKARTEQPRHIPIHSDDAEVSTATTPPNSRLTARFGTGPIVFEAADRMLGYSSSRMFYGSIVAEFSAAREIGIFGGDRLLDTYPVYSTIATSIRRLIPLTIIRNQLLDLGIFALLAKYFGTLTQDGKLVKLADSSYTAALGQLHRRLGGVSSFTQHHEQDDDKCQIVLYSCLALLLFESIARSPITLRVEIHVDGALSLLQTMRPRRQYLPRLRCVLGGIRGLVIYMAFRRRRATFLADAQWRSLSSISTEMSWVEKLHDIAVQLPTLLQRSDALKTLPREHNLLSAHSTLQTDYLQLKSAFDSWFQELIRSEREPIYWTSDETTPISQPIMHFDPVCKPSFPDQTYQLRFKDGSKAGLLAHYWAFQLQLLLGLIDLHRDQEELLFACVDDLDQVGRQEQADLETRRELEAGQVARCLVEAVNYISCCLEGCIVAQGPWEVVMRYHEHLQRRQVNE